MEDDIRNINVASDLAQIRMFGRSVKEFSVGAHTEFWPESVIKTWSFTEAGPMLVAVDSRNRVVGFLLSAFCGNGVTTIENIYIDKMSRGRGLASAMLYRAEKHAVRSAASLLRSLNHEDNNAMSHLMNKQGYGHGGVVYWCAGTPKSMEPKQATQTSATQYVRPVTLGIDINVSWLRNARCQGLVGPSTSEYSLLSELVGGADILLGVSRSGDLVAVVATSIHGPTGKATIELVASTRDPRAEPSFAALLQETVHVLKERGVAYVVAYPQVDDHELATQLIAAGFTLHRKFEIRWKHLRSAAPVG